MKRFRLLLILTGLLSAIVGGTVVYLALSVPNDLRADALLASAKKDIAAGKNDTARETLSRVLQQYPRTDAAAAATVALVTLAQKEHLQLARGLELTRTHDAQQSATIDGLQKRVTKLEQPPPVAPPAAKPATAKKAPVKKKTRSRRR